MVTLWLSTALGLLVALHLEFVTSSNKHKKSSFDVLVQILARIHARALALYVSVLKYTRRKHLNCAR